MVAALLVLNLALKLCWTGVNELAGDEPFTVYWAQRPLSELFGMLLTENNPPLYFLLMHGWSQMVPLDPGWLRIPSAVFSALTVWPLFLLGKRLGGRTAGLTAALLYSFSQHSYGFAHEVRAYSLFVLACTWAIWQLLRLANDAHRHPSQRSASIIWLVLANVVATWAHYFGWLMVGLELVLVFAVPMLRTMRVKMLVTTVLTAVCSIPMLGILFSRAGSSLGHGTWVDVPGWEEPYNMVMRWSNAPVVAVIFLALISLALARGRMRHMAIPLLWCGLPLIGMFIVSFLFPIYLDRYLFFASIGFYLLVALAAAVLIPNKKLGWMVPLGCVLGMAITFFPWKSNRLHPSQVVAQVEEWKVGPTAVIRQPAWYDLTYAWASDPALFQGAAPVEMAMRAHEIFPITGSKMPLLDTATTTVIHIDAWAALTDPGHNILNRLRSRFLQVDSAEADRKVIVRRFRHR